MILPEDFNAIVGKTLSAVTFVLDYWELDFDGNALTVMSRLAVEAKGRRTRDTEPGFRDLLCELIGETAATVELTPQFLAVAFKDGRRVEASLRHEDYRGADAIHFGQQGRLYVR